MSTRRAEELLFQAGANLLDWLQTLLLTLLNLLLLTQAAGNRPEPLVPAVALCAAMLACHGLWQILSRDGRGLSLHPFLLWLLPLWALLLLHALWLSPSPWLAQRELLVASLALTGFWIGSHHLRKPAQVYTLLIGIAAATVLALAFALLQGTTQMEALPWVVDLLGRGLIKTNSELASSGIASGSFSSNLQFASLIGPAALALCVFALATRFNTPSRIAMLVLCWLCLCALVLSRSLGAMVVTAVLLFAAPFIARSKDLSLRQATGLVAGLLLSALLVAWVGSGDTRAWIAAGMPSEFDALWYGLNGNGWAQLGANLLSGSGSGNYPIAFEAYRPELFPATHVQSPSTLVKIAAETGLPGLLAAIGIGLYLLLKLFQGWRELPQNVPVESEGLERHARRTCQPLRKVLLGGLLLALLAFAMLLPLYHPFALPAIAVLAMSLFGLAARQVPSLTPLRLPVNARSYTLVPAVMAALAALLLYSGIPQLLSERHTLQTAALADEWEQLSALQLQQLERHIDYQIGQVQTATDLAPDNAPAWLQLSRLYLIKAMAGQPSAGDAETLAQDAARHALQIQPDYLPAWLVLAQAEQRSGNLPTAEAALEKALACAPNNPECWYQMASLLKQEPGARERAITAANHALRLDPDNPRTQRLQWQLMIP